VSETTRSRSESFSETRSGEERPVIGRSRGGSLRSSGKRGSTEWRDRSDWLLTAMQIRVPEEGLPDSSEESEDSSDVVQPPPRSTRPPQIQQVVESKLMTFDQLAQKIGHRPHPDKTMKIPLKGVVTVRKMSTAYKEVETELASTLDVIDKTGRTSLTDFDAQKKEEARQRIATQIAELRKAANAYKDKHRKNTGKTDAIKEMLKSVDDYESMVNEGLDAVLDDPSFASVKDHLDLEQALYAKKCGINFADCKFDVYNDENAEEVDEKFGSGMANSVAKVKYKGGEKLVFKREKASESFLEQLPIARAVGIDGNATHNGNRNFATSAVGDLLGASVLPKVAYGLHKNPETGENQIGLLMSLAPGVTPLTTNEQGVKVRRKLWESDAPPSAKAQAKLQEQLAELDWCDVITGQQDRHGSNYLVEIKGDDVVVTGIDNDVCFGAKQDKASVSKGDYGSRTTPPGLPPLIPKKVYDKLVASDFDRDLAPKLSSLLTQDEVEATRKRFDQVKSHAQSLQPDFVVANYETWQSPDGKSSKVYLKECGTGVGAASSGGLFGRDFAAMFEKDGIL
jgi:vacuolar-type H+-ATPase subunit E/Vma4